MERLWTNMLPKSHTRQDYVDVLRMFVRVDLGVSVMRGKFDCG